MQVVQFTKSQIRRLEIQEKTIKGTIFCAATAFTQSAVGVLHIYLFHLRAGAIQAAFFNSFSEEHPLRVALAPFMKYTIQFDSLVLENKAPLPGFPYHNTEPDSLKFFHPILQKWNEPAETYPVYTETDIETIFEKNGLNELVEQTPTLKAHRQFGQYAQGISHIVEDLYSSNLVIQNDVQLQTFLTEVNKTLILTHEATFDLETVRKLFEVAIYNNIAHSSARTPTYSVLTKPPIAFSSITCNDIMNENITQYSANDIRRCVGSAEVLTSLTTFLTTFMTGPVFDPQESYGSNSNLLFRCDNMGKLYREYLTQLHKIKQYGEVPMSSLDRLPINQEA